MVGVIPDLKERTFLTHLLISCARQYGLFMLGRPEWFMAISPNLYKVSTLHSITAHVFHACEFSGLVFCCSIAVRTQHLLVMVFRFVGEGV